MHASYAPTQSPSGTGGISYSRGLLMTASGHSQESQRSRAAQTGPVPRYLRAHHAVRMSVKVADLRAGGFMTSREAASVLGIGVTTLIRMEGVAYPVVPRRGKRGMRVFAPETVEQARDFSGCQHAVR